MHFAVAITLALCIVAALYICTLNMRHLTSTADIRLQMFRSGEGQPGRPTVPNCQLLHRTSLGVRARVRRRRVL
jgi:hypothetical protein